MMPDWNDFQRMVIQMWFGLLLMTAAWVAWEPIVNRWLR